MDAKNITVRLPMPLHRRLTRQCRVLAKRTGLATRSQVIREALVAWLDQAETDGLIDAATQGESRVRSEN